MNKFPLFAYSLFALLLMSVEVRSQLLPYADEASTYPFSMGIDEIFAPRETPLQAYEYELGYLRCAGLLMLLGEQALHDGLAVDERLLDEKINTLSITAALYGGIVFDDSMTADEVMAITNQHFESKGRSLMLEYVDWINAHDIRAADSDRYKDHPLTKDRDFCDKIAVGLIKKYEAVGS